MSDKKIPLGISVITIIMYIQAIFGIAAGIFLIVDKDAPPSPVCWPWGCVRAATACGCSSP
jgi:hypothetical protein